MLININKQLFTINEDIKNDEYYLSQSSGILYVNSLLKKEYTSLEGNIFNAFKLAPNHETATQYFVGGYFIVWFDNDTKILTILRDQSGLKTGYIHINSNHKEIWISTNMHDIAKNINTDFSELYVDFLLYQSYLPDGHTIYYNIDEVHIGEVKTINLENYKVSNFIDDLPVHFEENKYNEVTNISLLRDNIIKVHEELAGENNVIYLSGGIDSCAMLASLHNISPQGIRNISYKVKGTHKDETVYAKKVANHLGYSVEIIEVDPSNANLIKDFEEEVLSFNNPYVGNWIYKPLKDSAMKKERYFAGQDTRLHTPAVSFIDKWVFGNISKKKNYNLIKNIIPTYEKLSMLFDLYSSSNGKIKYSHLALSVFNSQEFINKRFFNLDKVRYKSMGYRNQYFKDIQNWYQTDIKEGMSEREIYNRIVKRKWKEQYINDIRYMVDMGRKQGVYTLLPFYEKELNLFNSTIPWEMSNKLIDGLGGFNNQKIRVNKYLLRKAFEKELPHDIMVRNKSVSNTFHLMFNGVLGDKVIEYIKLDLESKDSFCRRFQIENKVKSILNKHHHSNWKEKNYADLNFTIYIGALIIYYRRNVLKK